MSRRVIVVGDVHGCIDEMDELIKKVDYKKGRDRLVFVGDLVDRGPDSRGCVRRAREVGAECLMGNHEYAHFCLYGGLPTKYTYTDQRKRFRDSLSRNDWDYIEKMPWILQLGPRIFTTHAGAEPATPLYQQDGETLCRIRKVNKYGKWTKGDYDEHHDGGYYWAYGWKGPESIIYGHQVHNLVEPVSYISNLPGTNAWTLGLDTGCCYGGRLTAAVFEDSDEFGENLEIVQVDAKATYSSYIMETDYERIKNKVSKESREWMQ